MSEQKHERMARIEGIDLDTGQFSMTLATEGEASDGDILSIKGGEIPERMPMLTSHWNDPSAQLGSITDPVKMLKDSPPRLMALGHIEMSGEGVSAEIRRDLAHMIDKGHVTGVSIRWDGVPGKPPVRRVNLPSDHPHFVDAETATGAARYGVYFEQWRAMEGSVVALGADPQALIGRALEASTPEVSRFWRQMAEDIDPDICRRGTPIDDPTDTIEDEDATPEARTAAALAALRTEAGFCHGIGASHADMINAVVDGSDADIESVEIGEHIVFLPGPPAAIVRLSLAADPVEPEPTAEEPVSREEMEHLLERLDALEAPPPTLEEDREPEEPVPSPTQECVDAAPLSAPKPSPEEFIEQVIVKLRDAHAPVVAPDSESVMRPREVSALLGRLLSDARNRVNEKFRADISKAQGRITDE